MNTEPAKNQNRVQNSHAASLYEVKEAEPGFEYINPRYQQLLDLAHDGDEFAQSELELIWATA